MEPQIKYPVQKGIGRKIMKIFELAVLSVVRYVSRGAPFGLSFDIRHPKWHFYGSSG